MPFRKKSQKKSPPPAKPRRIVAAVSAPTVKPPKASDDDEPTPEELAETEAELAAEAKALKVAKAAAAAEPTPASRERGSYDGDTAIKLYLREIGQVALLTVQEEIELAARIKVGDKKAREQMIKANLRLVVKIAHDYEGFGLPLLDLISVATSA